MNILKDFISDCKYPVFFTGAGISTDSGIPDFRGPKGFWKNNTPIYYQDFISSEESRIKYWEQSINFKSNFGSFLPNEGHKAISKIIFQKKQGHCITQNVDNLHQEGGLSENDLTEIHGNATFATCLKCNLKIDLESIHDEFKKTNIPPVCFTCNGFIKTATISFGQPMPQEEMQRAQLESLKADLFIVVGSSLVVYPAASLPLVAKENGAKLIIINNEKTDFDNLADLVINESITKTFEELFN